MTDFETEVRTVLDALRTQWANGEITEDFSTWLAPRVAAAIEAAMRDFNERWPHRARESAVAALRGSGETPQP